MNIPENAVVLAQGPGATKAALTFALAEARLAKRPLHVVHVLQLPAAEAYAAYAIALEAAKTTLADLVQQTSSLTADEVPVTGEVVNDSGVVHELTRGTRGASMIVMEHRAFSPTHRLLVGSVVKSVVSRAAVPVVSVPQSWTSTQHRTGRVTAAIQDPEGATAILRAAFEVAERRHTALVVLHAWWLASGYDVVAVDEPLRAERAAEFRRQLAPALHQLEQDFPTVDVTVEVRHAPPLEAVLDAAAASDIVIIGRRHHLLPLGSHLGPVARGVLAHSPVPVLITPEPVTTPTAATAHGLAVTGPLY
jgi:nucleotide-binding universal stress UspA family protein